MKHLLFAVCIAVPLYALCLPARVVRVIDGDTFVIETGEHVRVIGINAPEMKTIYGEPAKEHLMVLIDGKTVDLENDHISADKDKYGRLLRYVFVDGVDVDKQMVKDGYAIAFLKFRFDKAEEYKQSELEARLKKLGIWLNNGNEIYSVKKARTRQHVWRTIRQIFKISVAGAIIFAIAFFLFKNLRAKGNRQQ